MMKLENLNSNKFKTLSNEQMAQIRGGERVRYSATGKIGEASNGDTFEYWNKETKNGIFGKWQDAGEVPGHVVD